MVARVLHPGKLRLETRHYCIGTWDTIGSAEVEIALVPFPIDVYNVIELRILRRRLDV